MILRKRRKKRTPLDVDPLRVPGQSLDEVFNERIMEVVAPWMFAALLAAVVAVMEWVRFLMHQPPRPVLYTAGAVAAFVVAFLMVRKEIPELRCIYQGRQGERVVGQALEELRTLGYRVLHDLPGDGFNVDHVLVGPAGVFVIETKTISKPGRGQTRIQYDGNHLLVNGQTPDRDPLVQVKAASGFVRRLIEADTGKRPALRAVVLYPGWFVEHQPKGSEVWVLNPKNLRSFVEHERSQTGEDDVAAFTRALEKHVRSHS